MWEPCNRELPQRAPQPGVIRDAFTHVALNASTCRRTFRSTTARHAAAARDGVNREEVVACLLRGATTHLAPFIPALPAPPPTSVLPARISRPAQPRPAASLSGGAVGVASPVLLQNKEEKAAAAGTDARTLSPHTCTT